jgi:hypothetical protein
MLRSLMETRRNLICTAARKSVAGHRFLRTAAFQKVQHHFVHQFVGAPDLATGETHEYGADGFRWRCKSSKPRSIDTEIVLTGCSSAAGETSPS